MAFVTANDFDGGPDFVLNVGRNLALSMGIVTNQTMISQIFQKYLKLIYLLQAFAYCICLMVKSNGFN